MEGVTGIIDMMEELLGRGIFAADGEEWLAHRKVAAQMFSQNKLKTFIEQVFQTHSGRLISQLDTYLKVSSRIDIQELFAAFTFDTICEVAMGVQRNETEIYLTSNRQSEFLKAFDSAQFVGMRYVLRNVCTF